MRGVGCPRSASPVPVSGLAMSPPRRPSQATPVPLTSRASRPPAVFAAIIGTTALAAATGVIAAAVTRPVGVAGAWSLPLVRAAALVWPPLVLVLRECLALGVGRPAAGVARDTWRRREVITGAVAFLVTAWVTMLLAG